LNYPKTILGEVPQGDNFVEIEVSIAKLFIYYII
jgi:hypothetical protein